MKTIPETATARQLHQETSKHSLSSRTLSAAEDAIGGRVRGLRAILPFLGPAFVAAVAYIDPGNFATNIQGGSEFGYSLLWAVVMANAMALLIQSLSAKLGIVSGQNLPELCRQYFSRPVTYAMWIISEIAAMATDLAEFLGATLGLNLLFHIPMMVATIITGIVTFAILSLDRRGFRPLEVVIVGLVMVIALSYVIETVLSHPAWGQVLDHAVVPWVGNASSVVLIVGIVGATVMPHVVYLHSGLTKSRIIPRNVNEARIIYRFERIDVAVAMTLAGLINMAMLYMAASVFHSSGHTAIATIPMAYKTLTPLLGGAAASVFLISLLASGVSSSAVGTMAGQVIMQGFVGFTIPVWIRRLITMLPTVFIVALGVNPTETLIISQVILSLVLPIPIIALVHFTGRHDIMGTLRNHLVVQVLAWLIVATIIVLNAILILQTLGISLPILS